MIYAKLCTILWKYCLVKKLEPAEPDIIVDNPSMAAALMDEENYYFNLIKIRPLFGILQSWFLILLLCVKIIEAGVILLAAFTLDWRHLHLPSTL